MTKKYIQPGNVIDYVAGAALSSGQMVVIGTRVAILNSDAAPGETVSASVVGVYEYEKVTANTFAQGADVYYDATAKKLTSTASGNTKAGYAFEAADGTATTVKIKING